MPQIQVPDVDLETFERPITTVLPQLTVRLIAGRVTVDEQYLRTTALPHFQASLIW